MTTDLDTLRIEDLIPPGLRLDTSFNNGQGYQLITTRAGSGALAADFAGSVTVSGFSGQGGALGADRHLRAGRGLRPEADRHGS